MMEIRIGEPVLHKGHKNTFKLVLSHWQNGIDHSYKTIWIDKNEINRFKDFLNLLAWCNHHHPDTVDLQQILDAIEDKHNYQFSRYFPPNEGVGDYAVIIPFIERFTYFDSLGIERQVDIVFDRFKPQKKPFGKR